MIEMLGVLAIVGILSVGGIAGYTKALEMYNSNLQRQQISELLAGMQQIQPNLNPKSTGTNITDIFEALNIVPEGLTYKNNQFKDKWNNKMAVYYGIEGNIILRYHLSIWLNNNKSKPSKEMMTYCTNIFRIGQENRTNILHVGWYHMNGDADDMQWKSIEYPGDKTCRKDKICLKDMSPVTIRQACLSCLSDRESCVVSISLEP